MSQETIDQMRSLYAAFSELAHGGDVAAFVARHYDPACEYEPIEEEEIVRGHEALIRWHERWFDAWDEFRVHVDEYIDAGDSAVLTAITVHAHGAGSGIGVDQRFFHVTELRDGKVLRMREYVVREEAFEAGGLAG